MKNKFRGIHWTQMPNYKEISNRIASKNKGQKRSVDFCKKRSELARNNGYGKWMTGKKLTEITKKKLSEMHKGNRAYQWKGGKSLCIDCGKLLSNYKAKRCKSCSRKGMRNSAWNGGLTPEKARIRHSIEMRLWREAVFARDNFTCQKYKTMGNKLRAHHICNFKDYPALRFAIDNGITLSEKAHREFHKKYGLKNTNKEQLLEFLSQIL